MNDKDRDLREMSTDDFIKTLQKALVAPMLAQSEETVRKMRTSHSQLSERLRELEAKPLGRCTHIVWAKGTLTSLSVDARVMTNPELKVVDLNDAMMMPQEVAQECAQMIQAAPERPPELDIVAEHIVTAHKIMLGMLQHHIDNASFCLTKLREAHGMKPSGVS